MFEKSENVSIPPTEVGIQFQWKLIIDSRHELRHELRHTDSMRCMPSTWKINNIPNELCCCRKMHSNQITISHRAHHKYNMFWNIHFYQSFIFLFFFLFGTFPCTLDSISFRSASFYHCSHCLVRLLNNKHFICTVDETVL